MQGKNLNMQTHKHLEREKQTFHLLEFKLQKSGEIIGIETKQKGKY